MKHGDFPVRYVNVYQRVLQTTEEKWTNICGFDWGFYVWPIPSNMWFRQWWPHGNWNGGQICRFLDRCNQPRNDDVDQQKWQRFKTIHPYSTPNRWYHKPFTHLEPWPCGFSNMLGGLGLQNSRNSMGLVLHPSPMPRPSSPLNTKVPGLCDPSGFAKWYHGLPGLVNVYITNWKDPPFLMGTSTINGHFQ